MEIHEYRKRVKALADLRNGGAIFNGSTDHAAIIVENLFSLAQNHVRILSGDLDARVYGNSKVVQRAVEFLGHSDHKLDIIIERNTLSSHHPLVMAIRDAKNATVMLLNKDASDATPYHLMTADTDCYRFEEVKGTHKAIAVFGDTSAHSLAKIHDELMDFSTPVPLDKLN
jgi:hypothetical protein